MTARGYCAADRRRSCNLNGRSHKCFRRRALERSVAAVSADDGGWLVIGKDFAFKHKKEPDHASRCAHIEAHEPDLGAMAINAIERKG